MQLKQNRNALTMIELIFVIVILGVVASIGSSIIAQLYDNYTTQRAIQRIGTKTELAIEQITNRLTYRVTNSVIAKDAAGGFISLANIPDNTTDKTHTTLEWIGYDNDSFASTTATCWAGQGGWSAYCDTSVDAPFIRTSGSCLGHTTRVVRNLRKSGTAPAHYGLIYSLHGSPAIPGTATPSNADCYGYNGDTSCVHRVIVRNEHTFETDKAAGSVNISSLYQLAWSAYAIVPVNIKSENLFDLALRYDYQPWDGKQLDSGESKILLRNVTAFKFSEVGGTMRVKLCATEETGRKHNISICKEKVVLR